MSVLAEKVGYKSLHIVCESTGSYDFKLLQFARKMGFQTSYVSGEAVHKCSVIEDNTDSKSDTKDPKIIFRLAKEGKTLTHRNLEGEYKILRELNRIYDGHQESSVALKNRIHHLFQRLYCDHQMDKDAPYGKSGGALMKLYNFSPYRMVKDSFKKFSEKMRKAAPGIRKVTLEKRYQEAQQSVLHQLEKEEVLVLEYRMENLWEEFQLHEKRKAEIKEKMIALYKSLEEKGEGIPQAKGFCSEYRIARILGETGRLSDFESENQLLKYGGMNLRERKSGQYAGKIKLSKKGRSPLRKVIGEGTFRLVRRGDIFGEYYHKKKAEGMSGTKAMVAVERKLLKVFYKLGVKKEEFDKERLHCCKSEYQKKVS